jgi:hypothetical protein
MLARTIAVLLLATLCLVGCSKKTNLDSKPQRLVPPTAAEVMASPDFKLEHTTPGGLQFYVRDLTPQVAQSISANSPDQEFLNGNEQSPYYFLVMIRGGKIMDTKAAAGGGMRLEDTGEIMNFTAKRDKKMQELLKSAPAP